MIFNLISFILELKKRDFRTSRIQKLSSLDIFKVAGRKNPRKLVSIAKPLISLNPGYLLSTLHIMIFGCITLS